MIFLPCEVVAMSVATELLSAEELAGRLHLRPETVRSWARRGLIPKVQFTPKVIRFDLAAVVEAVTKRQTADKEASR